MTEARNLIWAMQFMDNDHTIGTMTMIAMKEFDEVGQYTESEVKQLEQIRRNTPEPVWESGAMEAHDQLVEYGKLVRSKLNNQVNTDTNGPNK